MSSKKKARPNFDRPESDWSQGYGEPRRDQAPNEAGGGWSSAPESGGWSSAPDSGGWSAAPESGGWSAAPDVKDEVKEEIKKDMDLYEHMGVDAGAKAEPAEDKAELARNEKEQDAPVDSRRKLGQSVGFLTADTTPMCCYPRSATCSSP